jgi:5-methylcytosine-specific restriction endonuclease McrA
LRAASENDIKPTMSFYAPRNPKEIKAERERARELRNSNWWTQKLAEGICYYCQQKFEEAQLTMDHLVPIGRGGASTKGNCVVCCKECNTLKGSRTAAEWQLEKLSGQ